jgi:uncharacterized membrane protein
MRAFLLAAAAALVLQQSACTHDSPTCDTDTVSFATEVQPILASNCTMSGCHNSQDKADGVNLSTYKGVSAQVKAGNPSSSDLYEVITDTGNDRMPPSPNPALTADQISIIKTWIEQGANNTNCP